MTPAVSVVVPTHDRLDLLPWTLGSVLATEGVDIEVVVVDDGSADGTSEWLRGLHDQRVHVLRLADAGGAAAARNAGLAHAAADWVAFCDDDDLWAPGKLAAQLEALRGDESAGWSATGAVSFDESRRIVEILRPAVGGDMLDRLLVANIIPAVTVVASTELVRSAGGFDEAQRSSEDWDLWIRLARLAPMVVVDRPLAGYRLWAGGKSRAVTRMAAAYDTFEARYRDVAEERNVRPDRSHHRRYLARQQLRNGDRFGAARTFVELAMAGRPAHFGRAAAALLAPRRYEQFATARGLQAAPQGWLDDARTWMREVQPARSATAQTS